MNSVWQKGVILKEGGYLARGTLPGKILRRERLQGGRTGVEPGRLFTSWYCALSMGASVLGTVPVMKELILDVLNEVESGNTWRGQCVLIHSGGRMQTAGRVCKEKFKPDVVLHNGMKTGFFLIFVLLILGAAITTSGCTAAAPSVPTKETPKLVQTPATTPNGTPMKTIGIIGGMSWLSTAEYYRIINEETRNKLGGLHSAKILMYSEDFAEIEQLQTEGNWPELTRRMITDAQRLENGGADSIVIATNTMHKTADDVQANIHIPVINIIDVTGQKVKENGYTKVILLGTKYTMEQDFYKGRLENKYNLTVIVPNQTERDYIHSVIFDELCQGQIKNESREEFKRIINRLADEEGAQGVILGCTEIPLLITQKDVNITVFDTTVIHAKAAAAFALNGT